ncbi:MAG TPA: chorismate synthase [Bdellovibrionota bacterium]|nr:chorismate synthase [Bdellovibrionota bacterium]
MHLRYLTAGESHGKALVGILEGMPSGLGLTRDQIQAEVRRRKLGHGRGARQKMEDDAVEILSGVRHGKTIGSPIALLIENKDWKNWANIMQPEATELPAERQLEVPRPGHADYAGGLKYGHADMRNILERASARETAMRVAIGSVARNFLQECGIEIASRITQIGSVEAAAEITTDRVEEINRIADASPVRCLDSGASERMVAEIDSAKQKGDSLGGVFEIIASGVPLGLGSHVHWDRRLGGRIGEAFMGLNAIKGVQIGLGFDSARVLGSEAHDELFPGRTPGLARRQTNRAGGIEGGMTTGEWIVIKAAMKPIATLMRPLHSVMLKTGAPEQAHVERSDVCAVPSAAVIGESLLALVLAEELLVKFGGDSMNEILPRLRDWNENTR